MKFIKTAFSIVLTSLLVVACIHFNGTKRKIDPDTPTFGNLNGVPMAIPAKYQFFPVVYQDDDIWNAEWIKKNSERVPTADMKITSFSLLLHLPDYTPFNPKNGDSWRHQKNRYGFNQDWITVAVHWNNHQAKLEERDWFKRYIDRSKEGNLPLASVASHYEIADQNIYGLRHEILVGPTSTQAEIFAQSWHKDFYSDIQGWSTKIECKRMSVNPFSVFTCEQTYVLPDIDSFITIEYNPQHLKDWRIIQDKISQIIREFEIRD
jgi:hypothetical protein